MLKFVLKYKNWMIFVKTRELYSDEPAYTRDPHPHFRRLPKLIQFFIFIHQGIYRSSGGKFRLYKLKRIKCWFGEHNYPKKYYSKSSFVRPTQCVECGYNRTKNSVIFVNSSLSAEITIDNDGIHKIRLLH